MVPCLQYSPFSFSGFLQIPSLACQVGSPGSPPLLFDMAGLGLGWKSANPHIGYFAVSIVSKAVLPLVSSHFFDILCRYGPPTRTDYRIVVENISSRVSWQVSFFVVCVFHMIFSLLILSRKCFRLFICVFDFVCQPLTHLLHLLSKACYVLEGPPLT